MNWYRPEVQGTKVSYPTWLWYLAHQVLRPQAGPEVTVKDGK
jgi:hypothetical protein